MKNFYEMMMLMENETLQKPDPVPLSKVDSNAAKVAVVSGQKDGVPKDDPIQANMGASGPVSGLKPTQSTLVSDKVLNFALAYLGGEQWMDLSQMDAIVSGDGAIMDGHHRWAAALIVNPGMKVGYTLITLPLEKLISILNVYTKGALGKEKGNPDAGETLAQAFANLEAKIRGAFSNGFQYGKSNYDAQTVQDRLAKMPGANGDANTGMEQMVQNAKAAASNQDMTKSATNLARADMPVIDKEQVAKLVTDLKTGNVDIMQPYSKDVLAAIGGQKNASVQQAQQPSVQANQAQQQPQVANQRPGPQQIQAAHTSHNGPRLNEWLVLSGVKSDK
jgi:hypothetical protein